MKVRKLIQTSGAALLFALCLTFLCGFTARADEGTLMAATDYLNVRSQPGTYGDILGVLSPGESVQVTGITGEWYHVKYKNQSAYVYQHYMGFSGDTPDSGPGSGKETDMEVTTALNFRTAPSTDAGIISVLSPGDRVQVTGKTDGWYEIKHNGKSGYVYAKYLNFINADSGNNSGSGERVMTTTVGVNFRQGPSEGTSIIGGFTKGTQLTVIGEERGWYKVRYNGTEGYVYSQWLS